MLIFRSSSVYACERLTYEFASAFFCVCVRASVCVWEREREREDEKEREKAHSYVLRDIGDILNAYQTYTQTHTDTQPHTYT